MLKKLLELFSLRKTFLKAYSTKSKKWRYLFYFGLAFKLIRFLTSKAKPKVIDQYDLEPGEYKLVVTQDKDV